MDKSTVTLSNGTRIAYLERAGGELPLVLLHGITDNARTYEPLLTGISPRCHVFALDLRGHGESTKRADRRRPEFSTPDTSSEGYPNLHNKVLHNLIRS